MSRRKLTVVEAAIRDASKELGLPRDHWDVERLATLNVMLKVARHRWAQGQSSGAASDMLVLMDSITALRKQAKLVEPLAITIRSIDSFKCSHCGQIGESETSPATPNMKQRTQSYGCGGAARQHG